MNYKKIMIVGCGNVGSNLSNMIALRSIYEKDIEELIIIDKDILHEPNFPYLGMSLQESKDLNFLRNPKVICLKYILNKIKSSSLIINTHYARYSDIDNNYTDDCLKIDCRDSEDLLSDFKIKLTHDGNYGSFVLNPINKDNIKNNRYVFSSNKYICNIFISDVCKIIFSEGEELNGNEFKQYLFDYRRSGKLLVFSN